MIAGSVCLVVSRRDALRSEHRLDSLLSREAIFLANNLVLVGLAFVVFWGTFFPLISEALTGTKAAVGPPWFDRYTVPLALVLVLLSGIGPRHRLAPGDAGQRAAQLPVAAVGRAGRRSSALVAPSASTGSATALIMFVLAAFVVGVRRAGVRARHAARGAR